MNLPDFDKTLAPWIGKTAKLMNIYIGDRLKSQGIDLTKEQMLLLRLLYENDGQMQNDLAIITERDKASLARLITGMEKKKLVARLPDKEDGRVNLIYLTREGKTVVASAMPVVAGIIAELQHGISAEEMKTAIDILKKVQKNISI